ncbi:hypothetical protein [Acuticoccus sediminis]|uniref:hypothetical protein n=1 Tax=Acuticoccus sediminis TaxID=2184697 RepID=UPI001CFE9435|nr:hypothetical protein [Acuticoccus sediminis]
MLTVLTWLWRQPRGRTIYTADHVNIWAAMVRRNLSMPHRIACVTSCAEGIDERVEIIDPPGDFEAVRIPTWPETMPQCLRRLSMFRPDAADIFGDRFACMDLDCVVGGPLDPLFDREDDIVLYRGTSVSRPYNGSMLLLRAGSRPHVFTSFSPQEATRAGRRFLGSDQAWVAHALGSGEATWTSRDGVCWRNHGNSDIADADPRVVFFPGDTKPWHFDDDWTLQHYRGDRGGRCLILGYAPTVWGEVTEALRDGPFDAVIASPEAAEHWPGEVMAVAHCDVEAERIAAQIGFDSVTFCGRTGRAAA